MEINMNKKQSSQNTVKPYVCGICNKNFTRRPYLKKHMIFHTGTKPFFCSLCSKRFESKTDLESHILVHTGTKPYACDRCKKSFANKTLLDNHMRIHTGVRPYTCQYCSKTFTQKGNLQSHVKIHTGDRAFSCEFCGRTFRQKGNLTIHLRVHSENFPFTCEFCGRGFKHKTRFKEHLKIHTEDLPHKCNFCSQSFRDRDEYRQHRRTHDLPKSHICEFCGKGFTKRTNLERHYNSHTGIKPFSCDICGKGFNDRYVLNRHVRVHTGDRPYACKLCDKRCSDPGNLKKHMRVHRSKMQPHSSLDNVSVDTSDKEEGFNCRESHPHNSLKDADFESNGKDTLGGNEGQQPSSLHNVSLMRHRREEGNGIFVKNSPETSFVVDKHVEDVHQTSDHLESSSDTHSGSPIQEETQLSRSFSLSTLSQGDVMFIESSDSKLPTHTDHGQRENSNSHSSEAAMFDPQLMEVLMEDLKKQSQKIDEFVKHSSGKGHQESLEITANQTQVMDGLVTQPRIEGQHTSETNNKMQVLKEDLLDFKSDGGHPRPIKELVQRKSRGYKKKTSRKINNGIVCSVQQVLNGDGMGRLDQSTATSCKVSEDVDKCGIITSDVESTEKTIPQSQLIQHEDQLQPKEQNLENSSIPEDSTVTENCCSFAENNSITNRVEENYKATIQDLTTANSSLKVQLQVSQSEKGRLEQLNKDLSGKLTALLTVHGELKSLLQNSDVKMVDFNVVRGLLDKGSWVCADFMSDTPR